MSHRQQAIAVLTQARDILAERITESVLNNVDRILDDAEGDSYLSEISNLDETLGVKLRTVSSLLASLPIDEASDVVDSEAAAGPISELPTMAEFALQIQANDLDKATATLGQLLNLDGTALRDAATYFYDRVVEEPDFVRKPVELQNEVRQGSMNASLMLIWHCFGLQGPPAIAVLQSLRQTSVV